MSGTQRIETWFLIPLVRNSDRKPHRAVLYGLLREELFATAGGQSGPTSAKIIDQIETVPGSWPDSVTKIIVEDESRKYTVIIEREKVPLLKEVLERAANSFDQDEILFIVHGIDESIKRNHGKGFLKNDPAGG